MIEDALVARVDSGRLTLPDRGPRKVLLHGHCHQKAYAAMGPVETLLQAAPNMTVETIKTSCCGMAGAFGYDRDTVDVSRAMAEADLLPAIRDAAPDALIVADGTSCRHQIADGAGRRARHVVRVLDDLLHAA